MRIKVGDPGSYETNVIDVATGEQLEAIEADSSEGWIRRWVRNSRGKIIDGITVKEPRTIRFEWVGDDPRPWSEGSGGLEA